MYFARGSNVYNRQQQQQQQQSPYSPHSAYVPKLGSGYSGSSAGLAEGPIGLRQSSMLRSHQEPEVSGFREHTTHLSNAPNYVGGQYSLTYGSTTQQIPVTSSKGNASSALELHGVYGSGLPDSPKLTSSDYVSSSGHVYGHKREQLYADRIAADYSPLERQQFGERHSYSSKDPLTDHQASRYADPNPYGHKLQQADVYDRLEQAALMRQEQLLKAQSLQSSVLDGNSRRADYLAGRGQAIHQSAQQHNQVQDPIAYGGRLDSDPHNFSLGSSSFGGQHSSSILGAAPQRNIEDLIYDQKSSNPGYGVSLPAGRDYGTGKGLHRTSLESDYPATLLTRGSLPIIDDHERKENDHHRDLLRDREKDRDRERLRERERERERARERERERDRERDREKARERERERDRILERRDKERARVSKGGLESRRDRTPPRSSRDLRSSSLGKDAAVSLRRESPRREASHRRHSPVREKRKEYACKVHSFNLTEIQKDYLSLDKRYPRLLVSSDCSKVVVHWPKGKLKVSYNTPVSFEHDFVQRKDSVELKGSSGKQLRDESGKYNTVWNAKLVLMSGLSQNALEDLLSDRNHGSRLPHLCNMLRFAILKKSSSFTMIGGPWDPVDGGDPSSDESSLISTALRYSKELTNLDLKDCQHWNRFLEIHYDRIGKNGLFSHKEVTVIFLPDLTDCLPSLNTWRNQWLAYKKATTESEQQHSLRNEKPVLKKEVVKDEADSLMKEANEGKQPEIKEVVSPMKTECELKREDIAHLAGSVSEKIIENIDGVESGGTRDDLKDPEEGAGSKTAQTTTMVKKKIIKKVVKQKVVDKKDGVENNTMQQGVVGFEKGTNEQTAPAEVTQKQDGPSSGRPAVKTVVRKKIVKKVPVRKISPKEVGDTPPAVTVVQELEPPKDVSSGSAPLGQESGVRTTTKRKIIKRVPKKKVSSTDANNVVADVSITGNMEVNSADKEQSQTSGMQNPGDSKVENEVNIKVEPNEVISEKVQLEDKMMTDEKAGSAPKLATEPGEGNHSSKDLATSKDRDLVKEKERSPRDRKDESQAKKTKDVKDQKMREEPPRHPGLILQTRGTKDSKLQSLSLSLDSLLDYTEKDIEESTFEVSLFAESLYEMLQYEMGCRIFLFLQKLRLNFITKRNRRKRGRDEISKRESGKTTPEKRAKKDVDGDNPSINAVMDEADTDNKNLVVKEKTSSVNEVKEIDMDAGVKEEEDPEEDPEEESEEEDPEEAEEDPVEEEMPDANASLAQDIKEENVEMGDTDAKVEKSSDGKVEPSAVEVENSSDGKVEPSAAKVESAVGMDNGLKKQGTTSVTLPDAETNGHNKTVEGNKKSSSGEMDKELLQAFRFFDRNRVGYIRVEDMRLIIHSLGKCLPHRDVKELVISALLESNTGRDDHILYEKLIRTGDRKVERSKSES